MLAVPHGYEDSVPTTKIIIAAVCVAALLVSVIKWRRHK